MLRYQAGGQRHEAWFLDAVTGLNEARQVAEAGFRGVGLWRLGAEDPDLWNVLKAEAWPAADYDPNQLSNLTAQKSVVTDGDGDVLRIVQTPHDGNRKVVREANGGYSEQYGLLPSYFVHRKPRRRHRQSAVPDFRRWARSALLTRRHPGHSEEPRRACHVLRDRRECGRIIRG